MLQIGPLDIIRRVLTLSLIAHLMLLISLQSFKLAPPQKKKIDIMQI